MINESVEQCISPTNFKLLEKYRNFSEKSICVTELETTSMQIEMCTILYL